MSGAKITEGEWRCDEDVNVDDHKPRQSFWVGFDPKHWPETHAEKREQWAANARLIAAAPDLLKACEAVLHDCDDLDMVPSNQPGREKQAFDMLHEAIRKTRGE